jgi:hypothetical protein
MPHASPSSMLAPWHLFKKLPCPNTFAKDCNYLPCFLVMATKQKLLFLFLCCLLLTSLVIPPAEGQVRRCFRACNVFARIVRRFCRSIIRPGLRRRCLITVNIGLLRCRRVCRPFPIAPTSVPGDLLDLAPGSGSGDGD